MKLIKTIPARVKTVNFLWCKKDCMKMNQGFRDARKKMKRKMTSCWWCNHKFVDGEMMALACAEGSGNKMLCQKCADKLHE